MVPNGRLLCALCKCFVILSFFVFFVFFWRIVFKGDEKNLEAILAKSGIVARIHWSEGQITTLAFMNFWNVNGWRTWGRI